MKNKIVIYVSGGIVQGVYCSDKNSKIDLFDDDDFDSDQVDREGRDKKEFYSQLEEAQGELFHIF